MRATTGKLKNWLQDQKENTVSFVLEKMLRRKLERYGRLLEFKLDSRQGAASVKVLLEGETDPVTVWIDEYQLISHRDGTSVAVTRARASRQWLTFLLEDFLLGRPLQVPAEYASYVKMVL